MAHVNQSPELPWGGVPWAQTKLIPNFSSENSSYSSSEKPFSPVIGHSLYSLQRTEMEEEEVLVLPLTTHSRPLYSRSARKS